MENADLQGWKVHRCCSSSGSAVRSVEFFRAHEYRNGNGANGNSARGAKPDISIYGQKSKHSARRLASISRGIDGKIGHGGTFHGDIYPDIETAHRSAT